MSGKSILMTEKAAEKRTLASDLNERGVKLVALSGSTSESIVKRNLPNASLVAVEDYDEGVKRLIAGDVDGMVADIPILAYTRNRYPDANLQLLMSPLSLEPMGIAIVKGDKQLENLLRNYLGVLRETGLLIQLYDRWFGVGAGDLYRQ